MPLTTSVVGSYTRPAWLIESLSKALASPAPATQDELDELTDQAKVMTMKEEEDAGIDFIGDGEQGRTNFYEYLVAGASGLKMAAATRPSNPSPIDEVEFGDTRQLARPLIVDRLEWLSDEPPTAKEARFLKKHTHNKTKITVASPSLILRRMWRPSETYPDYDSARNAVVEFSRKELDSILREKIDFVQFDAPELTTYADDRVDDSSTKMEMQKAVEVINEVTSGHKEGSTRFGIHVCWGNYRGTHRADGRLAKIYPWLLELKVDQLVLELASARHEDDIEVFREYPSKMEIGAGVVEVKTPDVEPVRVINKRIKRLLSNIDREKLWLNSDCGFASNFKGTLVPRKSCFEKLKALSLAAHEAY